MATILVVDDDRHIRDVVRFALEQAGHHVVEAGDGAEALTSFRSHSCDLIVLDVLMPEQDGLQVCLRVREASSIPIIFLSSQDEELDRILGLELGADDYITKPFSPRELVARVKAALRRYDELRAAKGLHAAGDSADFPSEPRIEHAGLVMLPERHECSYDGHPLEFTVTEFGLLKSLLKHPGRVFSREALVRQAYGDDHYISDRTVDSHVRRVRKKLAQVGADSIETVYGVGYRLKDAP
jgi:two-component system OmpR family response regulator